MTDAIQRPRTLTFTELKGSIFHVEQVTQPWNIQMEVTAGGTIDVSRLQDTIVSACARHPLARARLRPWKLGDRAYRWSVPDAADVAALRARGVHRRRCAGRPARGALRAAACAGRVSAAARRAGTARARRQRAVLP